MKIFLRQQTLFELLSVIIASLLLSTYFLELWNVDWRIPFQYAGGDAFQSHAVFKSIIDTGTYLENPFLGAPGGLEYYDFPRTDHIQLIIARALSWFSLDFALNINIFFVLTFPLTAAIAFLVLRYFGISFLSAFVSSLLYSMLPFHFIRGQSHLFLNFYSFVPLGIALALWVGRDDPFLRRNTKGKLRPSKVGFVAILFCVLIASAGTYYTFFSCFAVLVAALYAFFKNRNRSHLYKAGFIVLLLISFALVNLIPVLEYWQREGKNPTVATRPVFEAELYSLKLVGLLLPGNGHRVAQLNKMMRQYPSSLMKENYAAYLGIVGVAGFLILLKWLFFPPAGPGKNELQGSLAVLNGSFLLLGLSGGIGPLFAFVLFSQIRAYTRVSIFIGFIALFAVGIVLDHLRIHFSKSKRSSLIAFFGLLAILTIGLWDQTIPAYAVKKPKQIDDFKNDASFVKQIESMLPHGESIFQLPYHSFPEAEGKHRMRDYDHFRGYLHSSKLRWSYGAIRGRKWDTWQQQIQTLPLPEFLQTLRAAGFRGLYFDRFGYPRRSNQENELKILLGEPVLESKDRRLIFFLL